FANEQGLGSYEALNRKFGKDPDFIAFTANIGKELKEDSAINGGGPASEGDCAVKTAERRQQLQALPAHDAKRPGIHAQLDALYDRKYNKQPRLGCAPRQIVGKPTPPMHNHRRHPSNGPACDGMQTTGTPQAQQSRCTPGMPARKADNRKASPYLHWSASNVLSNHRSLCPAVRR